MYYVICTACGHCSFCKEVCTGASVVIRMNFKDMSEEKEEQEQQEEDSLEEDGVKEDTEENA